MNMPVRVLFLVLIGMAAVAVAQLGADEPAAQVPAKKGAPATASGAAPTPDDVWQRLKEGNARFVAGNLREAVLGTQQRIELSRGQRPIAAILTCSDSRAAPEIVFDKGLGVLFVVRVAGNVEGPAVNASIEYALAALQTPLIVVLGHTNCGAVDAALQGKRQPTPNLQHLVELISTGDDLPVDSAAALNEAIRNNVLAQAKRLTADSPMIRSFVASGKAKIVPAIYNLKTGAVEWLELPGK